MTDPTDSSTPKIPRKKPRRDPATIDLPARVVDESRPVDPPDAGEAERIREAVAIEMAAPANPDRVTDSPDLPPPPPPSDTVAGVFANDRPSAGPSERAPRDKAFLPLLAAALLGGVVGAALLFGLQSMRATSGDQRLSALEQRVGALPPPGAPATAVQALATRIQSLEAAKSATEQAVSAAQASAQQALTRAAATVPAEQDKAVVGELNQRLTGLEGQIQSTQQASASARQAIETQVVDLSKRVGQGPDDSTKAAIRIVLAQRVGEALRTGEPYAEALQALRRSGAEAARLQSLEPSAAQGAPTAAALRQAFEPLSAALLRDDRAASGTLTDRLLRMADRVVTIRPVNEPGSSDVPSLVARIGQALDRGDVQAAVAAWNALPEPSRRLSAEWGARATARATADQGAQALATDALAVLNAQAQ
ncbi:COG4223 family protein [Microvirga antarctica]|uniref:COG4223 family protein n=1 Tax=Microvirga antarctica TaxID=2819233 RepID=UPI001B310A75|nr:hypothetical protein [Microvirga antarctica]